MTETKVIFDIKATKHRVVDPAIPFTQFWDMHSGGGQKEKFSQCFIQAPQKEAEIVFQNRFGHNPHRVSCTCCGADYSIYEEETLEEATRFHRRGMSLDAYVREPNVLVIYASEISDSERGGELKQEGWVWR